MISFVFGAIVGAVVTFNRDKIAAKAREVYASVRAKVREKTGR